MKKTLSTLSLTLTLLLGWTLPARAGLVTPAGLNPGDQFRVIFVSSAEGDSNWTNIADYDQFITDLAVAAGIDTYFGAPVTWQILGSTETVSAISRLPASSPALYRIDGGKIADNGSDLWDGNIDAPINVDELGVKDIVARAATGTSPDGSIGLFLGDISGFVVETGRTESTDGAWIGTEGGGSGPGWRFYGFSSVLTVPQQTPGVPEPASLTLLGCGALGLLAGSRRRSREAQ